MSKPYKSTRKIPGLYVTLLLLICGLFLAAVMILGVPPLWPETIQPFLQGDFSSLFNYWPFK